MRDDIVHLTLNELLDANARFDLAAKGTTNHCPMALIALAKMGASPERLRQFFDRWEREVALIAPPVDTTITRRDWTEHLGDLAAFGALRQCFQDWVMDAGPVPVIEAVLQAGRFAPASNAFHALIRLAYGIEAGHAGEIASGLASFVASYLPIDVTLETIAGQIASKPHSTTSPGHCAARRYRKTSSPRACVRLPATCGSARPCLRPRPTPPCWTTWRARPSALTGVSRTSPCSIRLPQPAPHASCLTSFETTWSSSCCRTSGLPCVRLTQRSAPSPPRHRPSRIAASTGTTSAEWRSPRTTST